LAGGSDALDRDPQLPVTLQQLRCEQRQPRADRHAIQRQRISTYVFGPRL
jgi:hypothetical protein